MLRRGAPTIVLVPLLAAGIAVYAFAPGPPAPPALGMVRATEIRVAPEVSGRLLALPVKSGDAVRAGDLLARLDNPELAASVVEAHATAAAARAERDRVYAGPRREQVEMLDREVQKTQSNVTLAEQQFARVSALAANQHASRQELDKAAADVGLAQSALAAARSRHAEAEAGPIGEERALADAQVAAAEATAVVLERRLAKTVLTAPVDGIVRVIVAERGEAIAPGRPVLTLEAGRERWFSFVLREDRLAGVTVGATLELGTEADKTVAARVSEIRGLGEFATWRSARAVGDHDLNSFIVRADPVADQGEMEPGMTVWMARGR
jgi:HlyD family secretion protein